MVADTTPLGETLIEQGRTQTWLAMHLSARLGRPVYRQEVHRWCKAGDRTPEPATREAIADILSVPLSDLFPAHSPEPSPHPPSADDLVGGFEEAA
jgi:hypothetical protein